MAVAGTPAGARSSARLSAGWNVAAAEPGPGVHHPHGHDRRESARVPAGDVDEHLGVAGQVEQVDLAAGADPDGHHVGHRLAGHDVDVRRRRHGGARRPHRDVARRRRLGDGDVDGDGHGVGRDTGLPATCRARVSPAANGAAAVPRPARLSMIRVGATGWNEVVAADAGAAGAPHDGHERNEHRSGERADPSETSPTRHRILQFAARPQEGSMQARAGWEHTPDGTGRHFASTLCVL